MIVAIHTVFKIGCPHACTNAIMVQVSQDVRPDGTPGAVTGIKYLNHEPLPTIRPEPARDRCQGGMGCSCEKVGCWSER